ncbi:MAG: hypothetical protein DMD42_13250 [Gemmatimonadetes bacterium]|nr:MAG: hypothetical protein DMD42_13250 [Gemmatimonadota bacterium]
MGDAGCVRTAAPRIPHPFHDAAQRPAAERSARLRGLEHFEASELLAVGGQQRDAALEVLEADPTLGLDDDVLAGAAERDALPEAIPHQGVV